MRNRSNIFVGILLAIALLAGIVILPQFLSSGARQAALREAEHARRQLHRYSPQVASLVRSADLDALKGADLSELTQAESFASLREEFERSLGAARRADAEARERGMPASDLRPLGADATGVQRAISAIEKSAAEQQQLLTNAIDLASNAAGAADDVGVGGQIEGAAYMSRAANSISDGQMILTRLAAELSALTMAAIDARTVQAELTRLEALNPGPALEALQADLAALGETGSEGEAAANALARRVGELEQQLQAANDRNRQLRDELLALEQAGYELGNDAAFQAYRDRYVAISRELQVLAERQQRIESGGVANAEFADDDFVSGERSTGEDQEGLATLRPQLEAARQQLSRVASARAALEKQVTMLRALQASTAEEKTRYAARLTKTREVLSQRAEAATKLLNEAIAEQDEALSAARRAEQAMARAGSAYDKFKRDAQTLRSEADAQNKNERLALIARDTTVQQLGPAGEAAAALLVGEAFAQRARALQAYQMAISHAASTVPGFAVSSEDQKTRTEQLQAAQADGMAALNKALERYTRFGDGQANTVWIYQALAAYTHYRLSGLDSAAAATHLDQTKALITKAVDRRAESPYLAPHVAFFVHLTGSPPQSTPPPSDATPEGETPAESAEPGAGESGG